MVLSESTGANALSASTTHYWHGLDALAQSDGTTTQYFAYDGLGSVRQLVDTTGSVGLAQTFDPYGNGYAKAGSAQSALGYSGEQVDADGFVYLRARYYNPSMGRFFQMDPSRQEMNIYQFALGNPVLFTDPSGLIHDPYTDPRASLAAYGVDLEANEAIKIINRLDTNYGIKVKVDFGWRTYVETAGTVVWLQYNPLITPMPCSDWEKGQWTLDELYVVETAIDDMVKTFARYGGDFRRALGTPKIVQEEAIDPLRAHYNPYIDTVVLEPSTAFLNNRSDDSMKIAKYRASARFTIFHEFGHAWNWKSGQMLAKDMRYAVGYGARIRCGELGCSLEAASDPPGIRKHAYPGDVKKSAEFEERDRAYLANIHEDWANSFSAFIDPSTAFEGPNVTRLNDVRKTFIENAILHPPLPIYW